MTDKEIVERAKEAPERLYLSRTIYSTYLYQVPDPDDETAVEYIRADAFIEKAKSWFERQNEWFDPNNVRHCDLEDFEDFKKYMED